MHPLLPQPTAALSTVIEASLGPGFLFPFINALSGTELVWQLHPSLTFSGGGGEDTFTLSGVLGGSLWLREEPGCNWLAWQE